MRHKNVGLNNVLVLGQNGSDFAYVAEKMTILANCLWKRTFIINKFYLNDTPGSCVMPGINLMSFGIAASMLDERRTLLIKHQYLINEKSYD